MGVGSPHFFCAAKGNRLRGRRPLCYNNGVRRQGRHRIERMTTEQQIIEFVKELCSIVKERAHDPSKTEMGLEFGKKYIRVTISTYGAKSVHCFVNASTGDVLKSASYKAPAKGIRYNLLDEQSRERCFRNADPYGGYLYAR